MTFYDPVRPAQDLEAELELESDLVLTRTVVLPRVTLENVRRAVRRLPADFFPPAGGHAGPVSG